MATFKAVVLGATGAVGRELVASLAREPHVSSIVAVSRSAPSSSDPEWLKQKFPSLDSENTSKVIPRAVSWESLYEEVYPKDENEKPKEKTYSDLFEGANYVGWALGTTRKDAGSADNFKRVDLDYCKAAAKLAKDSNVPHFGMVSSAGANASSWFLYMKTKGEAEDFVKELHFETTSIYQPGLLNRNDLSRSNESIAMKFMKSLKVSDLGSVMAKHSGPQKVPKGMTLYTDKDIRAGSAK